MKVNQRKREEFAAIVVLLRGYFCNISEAAKKQPKYEEVNGLVSELYNSFQPFFTSEFTVKMCTDFANEIELYLNRLDTNKDLDTMIEYLVNALLSVFSKLLKTLKRTDIDWRVVSDSKVNEIDFFRAGLLIDRKIHKGLCEWIDSYVSKLKIID